MIPYRCHMSSYSFLVCKTSGDWGKNLQRDWQKTHDTLWSCRPLDKHTYHIVRSIWQWHLCITMTAAWSYAYQYYIVHSSIAQNWTMKSLCVNEHLLTVPVADRGSWCKWGANDFHLRTILSLTTSHLQHWNVFHEPRYFIAGGSVGQKNTTLYAKATKSTEVLWRR